MDELGPLSSRSILPASRSSRESPTGNRSIRKLMRPNSAPAGRYRRPQELPLQSDFTRLPSTDEEPENASTITNAVSKFDKLNKRGFLLIINFMFSDEKERAGSDEDVGNLCKFFIKLQYDIHCKGDLTTQALKVYFEHVRHTYLSRDSSEYHSFICVIMSHGNEKGISTKDGSISIDEIVHFFRNDVLTQFLGKPKIFIFQACRAKEIPQKKENDKSRRIIHSDSSAQLQLPTDADIFRIYATSPGHISFRTWNGSWLINAFLRKAKQMYVHYHIADIMTAVKNELSTNPDYERDGEKCQIASTEDTLTKHFYL